MFRPSRLVSFPVLGLALLLAPSAGQAEECGWVNGSDPKAPPGDSNRGLLDPKPHADYAAIPGGRSDGPNLIGARMTALFRCLDRATYAKVYADASVLTAAAGRQHAGWVDADDPKAPGDSGRGRSNYAAHEQDALGPKGPNAGALLNARLASLVPRLPGNQWGLLYSSLSITLAKAGASTAQAVTYNCEGGANWSIDKMSTPLKFVYQVTGAQPATIKGTFVAPKGQGTLEGSENNDSWQLVMKLPPPPKEAFGWHRTLNGKGSIDTVGQRFLVKGNVSHTVTFNGQNSVTTTGTFDVSGSCRPQ